MYTGAIDKALAEQVSGVNVIARGGLERVVRCFYCGDSSNLEHGHLGITRQFPLMFKCQRCGFSGSVNEQFLTNLGVTITDEIRNELSSNKLAVGQWASKRGNERTKQVQTFLQKNSLRSSYRLPEIHRNASTVAKYKYLCDRFNHKFTMEELKAIKFMPSLRDFVNLNYITSLNEEIRTLDCLEENYVMFPAFEGTKLICRNITKHDLLGRYYEIKLKESGYRFYTIESNLDINNPNVNIIAAEGIFDAIGIWVKYPELSKHPNTVFSAMLSKGYYPLSNFLIQLGFIKQNINVFADNDVTDNYYRLPYEKYKLMRELGCQLSVYHNKLDFDWGIPPSKIEFIKSKLL